MNLPAAVAEHSDSAEGASPAGWHLSLPPDHAETDHNARGRRDTHIVLLAGEQARALFDWCRRHEVPAAQAVQRLTEYLAERWSRNMPAEPGATVGRFLVDGTRGVTAARSAADPGSPGALSMALDAAPDATGGAVTLTASWDEDTLGQQTAAAFLDALRTLVAGWLAGPETELADLPLLSHAALDGLLTLGGGGTPSEVRYRTALEAIVDWAERRPLAPAVRYARRTLSYRDLIRQAATTAAELRSAGVCQGDRVLLHGAQSDLTVAGMLACHLIGASYVPVDVESPVARMKQIATSTGATACLWADEAGEEVPESDFLPVEMPVVRTPRDLAAQPVTLCLPEPSAAAYVLSSSGSTGVPKGIEVSQGSLGHFCREINAAYGITPEDRVLAFARPVFDVSVFEVFATLAAGAQVVIPDPDTRMDPILLTGFLHTEGVTVAELPPALLPLLDPADLPYLRLVSVGGEAVPGALVADWACSEREMWNGYGPTETTVAVTLQRLTGEWTASPPIGRPIPGCTAFVVDEALMLRPRGAVGELCIAGPSLAVGYLNDPVRTAAAFVELPQVPGTRVYRTGDLVRWRGDGALEYLGRIDRQVKVNGFRVELSEVEGVLASVGAVRQAAVEMVDAVGGGRALGALVVSNDVLDHGAVLEEVRKVLPPYAVPTHLVSADVLPLTPNGKVDRAAVRLLLGES
ncbi:amino acid adenylation domain-containing protein [Salinispora pacifica]|uniref:amino acid adenylation domain-containing protein n=1 Tax=Salinispora pacifica TaxID=351187 RepID=UPI0004AFA40B|nr:amino acid adenylation domain-containing protein [Salinispora pacifica]